MLQIIDNFWGLPETQITERFGDIGLIFENILEVLLIDVMCMEIVRSNKNNGNWDSGLGLGLAK